MMPTEFHGGWLVLVYLAGVMFTAAIIGAFGGERPDSALAIMWPAFLLFAPLFLVFVSLEVIAKAGAWLGERFRR